MLSPFPAEALGSSGTRTPRLHPVTSTAFLERQQRQTPCLFQATVAGFEWF